MWYIYSWKKKNWDFWTNINIFRAPEKCVIFQVSGGMQFESSGPNFDEAWENSVTNFNQIKLILVID